MSDALDFLLDDKTVMVVPGLEFLEAAPILDVVIDDLPPGSEDAFVEMPGGGPLVPASLADRIAQCGALRHKPDWRTGKLAGYYQKCGLHLYCHSCLLDRAQGEAKRVFDAVGEDGVVRVLNVPAGEDTAKIVRGIDSGCYRRYPREDGSTDIVHMAADIGGEEVPVDDLNWLVLVRTPEGSNWSGKLGSSPPVTEKKDAAEEEERGESKLVRIPEFTVQDAHNRMDVEQKEDHRRCWEFATLATVKLEPTLDDVAWAMAERMRHYRSALVEKGYDVRFFVYEYERAYAAEIDWKPYNELIRKKLQAQGYTNVALDPPGADGA